MPIVTALGILLREIRVVQGQPRLRCLLGQTHRPNQYRQYLIELNLSSQLILGCVKLTIIANHHTVDIVKVVLFVSITPAQS